MKFTKEKIFVLILFVATISILLWPMLFDNMVFSQKFVFDESMSFNAYFANHFDDHLPLWFQGHTHGFPGYLSQSGGFMHPLILLLFKLFSYITAYNLLVFFNLLVCGIATYVLARRLKMSIGAGIIASFVYTFSHLSVWAHAISALGSMLTVLPVLMLCVLEMHRARKKLRRYVFILFSILVLGLGWMAGYTEGVLYNVIACFFFALFLDISFYLKNKKEHSCADCFQTTGAMVVIIVLGTLLASPWIISVVNFLGETRRSITPSPTLSEFIGSTSLNFEKIIQAIYPYFSVSHSEYIPFINTDHENGYLYVGILPLFFGFLGLLNWKKNKQSIFFAGFFIFTLLTFLPYLPLNWLIHKLPVFGLFRDYWKWVYVMVFCWAMLAGYGFDLLKETYKTKKFKLFSKIFEGTAFCIVILAFLVNLIFVFFKDKIIIFGQNYFNKVSSENIGLQDASSGVDLSHIYGIITQTINEVSWNVSLLNPYFLGSMIFLLFSALLLLLLRKGWLGLATFKFLSVILVILNLSLLWQGYYKPVSASMLQDPPPTVKFLQELSKKEDFRVIKFPLYTRYNLDLNLEASDYVSRLEFDIASLSPNYNLYYDIDSIYGGDGFRPLRHERMTSYTIGGLGNSVDTNLKNEGVGYQMSLDDRIEALGSPLSMNFLSMMNVKYISTISLMPAPWNLVFESTVTRNEIPMYIYENPDVLPRIYFAKDVKIVPKDIEIAFDELKKIEDFTKTTLIECDNTLCLSVNPKNISSKDSIMIEEKEFDYLKIETNTKTPRWLVYSQSNFPTWDVRIDDRPTNTYTANYIYQAIFIPAGEHEIEFKYPGFLEQSYRALQNILKNIDL